MGKNGYKRVRGTINVRYSMEGRVRKGRNDKSEILDRRKKYAIRTFLSTEAVALSNLFFYV